QVLVKEISAPGGEEVPEGLKGAVILNPDIENPDIENPDIENPDIENPDIENYEVHNPDIENPDIENPDIENTQVINPDIENPDIENNDIINPDIENPDIENPDIENLNIMNPDIENPTIMTPDIENGSLSDYTWRVKNIGNTASSYRFRMIAAGFEASDYPGFGFQLLIYRVYTSPVAANCTLKQTHHDELLANIVGPDIINPDIENPDIENPDIENPDIENATFWLAPGDEAYITLRVYDPNENDDVKFDFNETPIEGVTTAQSVNSQDEIAGKTVPPIASPYSNLTIYNSSLPNGETDTSYTAYLVALGGTPHYTWSYSGTLPPGVSFNGATGVLFGTPTTAGTFPFTAQVTDSANPPNTASENLQIVISPPCTVSTPDIPTGTATGGINVAYTFTTGGATDSQGHPVEYRLEWSPGQYTGWSSSSAISVTFTTTETYQIKAQARCQLHNSVTSPWSAAKKVTIYNSVSTIQGYLTYNANPVTNMPDASGKQAEIILTDETTYQRFPSTPTYDTSTGFYSIPNIPQGTYGFEVRIDAGAPSNGKHLPGDYDGITNNVSVPTGPTVVTQNLSVQKLLHLLAPIDNSIVQHWPGPVFDIFTSPLLMDWDVLSEAAFYRYRADKVDSSDYHVIWTTDYIDTTASQVSLTLTPNSSAPPDHYQFSLYAYNSSNLLVGKLMLEYVSGYGWDYRFRIAPGDITPPVVSSLTPAAGATDVAFAAPLSISFDENVMKGTGNIVIKKSANDAVFQTIDVTSGLVTIASDVVTISHDVLGAATGYYVQVEATCFDDLAGNSYGGISDTTTWSFTATDIPGLLAYYPFNANAADASGNGNDGTIQGSAPVFVPDRLGQANGALQFNGDNNYVDLPNESSFDLTTFTIVAIIKVQDFSRPNHIISKGPEFGNYTLRIDGGIDPFSGEAAYYHQTGTGNWSAPVSASVIAQNEFVHLAVTLNTSSYFGYMNGQQTYTGGGPPPPVLNNDLVTIGRAMLSSTPRYFLGVVDEIRIYNRVLSDNEIKALYNRDR
ncbi:MAG: Ig-like domain-containing protein, partial [Candidatus Aminicenantes bacterium]|nr:Ig-like domain-containing protein [Candidatus Aminicenantes bacterium]